jgi:hypothetical protein
LDLVAGQHPDRRQAHVRIPEIDHGP